jgi:hypothetical protein
MQRQSVLRSWSSRLVFAQLLFWACMFLPTLALAVGQPSTYPGCQTRNVTVAWGGTVPVNMSTCHFFGLGTVRPGFFPSHGNATPGPQPVNIYNYQHNGSTPSGGGTDVFHVLDDNSDFIIVTVTIQPPSSPITVLPASLPTLRAGEPFSQTLSSSGGLAPYTYSLQSGSLPLGLSRSGAVISGTPTQRGPYAFTIRSTDSTSPTAQFVDKGYSGNVLSFPISLVPASATAIQSVPISQALNIVGGLAPHTCQLETGSFPAGISVTPACVITGVTTVAPASFPVSIRVTDASTGPGAFFEVENFTLVVSPPPSVSIAVSPSSVSEDGATNMTYTVTRSLNISSSTTVNITTGGTATSGSDYTGGVATVVIPANATTATFPIDPSVDGDVEPNETVILTVAAGAGYTVAAAPNNSATGTILNDDVPAVTIAVAPSSVLEDGPTNLVYTVTLNQANPSAATTVNYTIGGTATNGADYTTITSPLIINAGSTSGTITVDPTSDVTIEANETVALSLALGTGYTIGGPNSATGTITNDDQPNLAINDLTANEGNGGTTNFTFTVSLSAPAGPGGVSFDIATANGTATSGVDYIANTLVSQAIPSGSSTYSFTVQVNGETLNEANETFFVNVTSVTGATVFDGQGLGTITNDDPLPSLSINDVSVTEGNSGTTNAAFAVTLNAASGQLVQVNYATADGTAAQPADYTFTIGTLTFTPGQTSRTITVPVVGDALLEPNETYFVNLSGTNNATISDNQGLGTILDDECPSSVVINGNDSGPGSLRQIIADACVGSTITFAPAVSTVTLTTAELLINKNLTIDGGSALVTVTRSTAGGTPQFRIFNVQSGNTVSMNALVVSNGNHPAQAGGIENNGSLTLTNMHITGNRAPQSGGIQNNSVLNLSNSSVTNNVVTLFGGGLAAFGPSTTTTLSNCTFTGNQADSDTGAIGAGGTSLSITSCTISGNTLVDPGGVGAGITVSGVPTTIRNTIVVGNTDGGGSQKNVDGTFQAASAFNVLGTGPAGGLINGTNNNQVGVATALLGTLGNYGGLTPTLPLLPGSVAINAGTNVSTPATDQRGIARPQLTTVDVGAFESRGFTLAISGGNSQSALIGTGFTNPLAVTVTPVSVGEPVQGGRVSYTPPGAGASATLATSPATINASGVASVTATANTAIGSYSVAANAIGNNGAALSFALENTAPGLSINDVTQSETNSGTSTFTFTVSLSAPAGAGGASFDIATANGTASSGSDYVASSLTGQTIAAGNSSRTFVVTVNGDTTFEANETFFVNVTNVTGATVTDGQGLGTINNDDVAPTLTINAPSVTEGNPPTNPPLNFVVSLNTASGLPVSFNFATNGPAGTATAGTDYTAVPSTAGSIAAGQSSVTLPVTVLGDLLSEGNETVVLDLSSITNANVTSLSGTGTIIDDEIPTLAINDVSITEGNSGTSTLNFTVTRTGFSPTAVGFNFATADDTATAGSDYVTATGTGTIPAGGATASTTVSVTINGDAVFENTERFFVNLSAPTNATIADGQGIGTINNDDTAPTLAINDVIIVEGNSGTSSLVFTVTRTGLTALPASFTATTANGTATAPSDYVAALAGATTIAAGGATGTTTLTATINGDNVVEANETFTVNLSAPVSASITTGTGTGTINNDDTAGVVITQSGGSTDVTEGGSTDSYTLVLTSQPTANVSIALTPNAQVTAATSPVVFTTANWNTPQSVTVTAVDDPIVEGPHTGTISHTVTSADAIYNNFTVANVVANITDNDTPGATIVQLGGTTAVTEGSTTDTYTVVLTSQPSSNVVVTPTGTQVSASPTSLTFTNGNWNTPQTVTVTASDDNVVEGTHSGSITHAVTSADSNYNNLSIAGVPNISITDNDSATVQFAPTSVSQSEATTPMAFTVTLSNPVASGVTVKVDSATGTAGTSDFTALLGGTVTFPANSTTAQTVHVTVNNDALDEDDESFTLTLSSPAATGTVTLGAASSATGTIQDDDALPVLSVANVSQPEGNASNTLSFTVNLTPVSGRAVSFTRATADATAVSTGPNADFVALAAGPISIAAGQTSVSIPVTINGDTVFEGNESFTLNLTAVNAATPGSLAGTGTILDDDQQPTTTEITSDEPDPSPVNAPYTVAVTVRGATSSPTGTVTVDDGTGASCGPVPLVAGTPPASSASCAITSTTPGTKTLTAIYTPSSTAFGASSDTEPHTVVVVAPALAYAPTTGATVAFTGVTTIGTAGNGTIAATPSGGAGTGAGATTTINTCTLGGTNPSVFAGAAAINLSFVGNTTTAQNLALTCTSQQTAQTATLTCNETRGTAAAVPRQWSLSCPAGPLLPLAATPAIGGTVNVTGTAGGSTTTAPITLTNPNPIPVSLTCTAPAFPFTATPLVFSIPTGGNAPVTIGISPAAAGSYTGTLSCTIAGSPQVLTFNLAGTLVPAIAVDAMAAWSRWLLVLLMLFGGLALGYSRRH